MKLALASVDEIVKENAENQDVLNACQIVLAEIKESIKVHHLSDEKERALIEVTELFGLYRTRVMLMLLRDVNRYGDNKPEIEQSFTMLLNIVEEKIENLQRGKENNYEKNTR